MTTCQCDCGCEAPGGLICDACDDYIEHDGDVICSRETREWTRCHECKSPIKWGSIQTAQWAPNWIEGRCKCGPVWRQTDAGGTWETAYREEED
jgi:hypothetical protein